VLLGQSAGLPCVIRGSTAIGLAEAVDGRGEVAEAQQPAGVRENSAGAGILDDGGAAAGQIAERRSLTQAVRCRTYEGLALRNRITPAP
jgi:hypothetical protein